MARNDGVPDPRNTEDIWESQASPVILGIPDPANPGKSSPASASNPLPVTVTNPAGAADVSALSKEATQLTIKALLQGTVAVSNASLPLPAGAATDAKLELVRALLAGTIAVSNASLPLPAGAASSAAQTAAQATLATLATQATAAAMLAALQGTLSVNPGTAERRTVISQQTLDLSAGTAVALPAVPNGATSLQIQPQGADVRLNVAGGTPTATSGLLFGLDGIYDLYVLTGVKLIGTVAGTGVQAELIWRA